MAEDEGKPGYGTDRPADASRMFTAWEGETVALRCRRCQRDFQGLRPRYWVEMARARGEESPWWWGICPSCQPAEDRDRERLLKRHPGAPPQPEEFTMPDAPKREDDDPGPWVGPEPTADEEYPF